MQLKQAETDPELRVRMGLVGKPRSEWFRALWTAWAPAADPPVDPWPSLASLFSAWCSLGRDYGGVTLYNERCEWLDRHRSEPGEWEAGEYLFAHLEAVNAEINNILYPPPKDKKK